MKIIGIIVVTITTMAVCTVIHGWAIATLWGWFIAPTFSLPPLNIPQAIGLSMVVGYFQTLPDANDKDDFTDIMLKGLVTSVLRALFAVGIARIVLFWM